MLTIHSSNWAINSGIGMVVIPVKAIRILMTHVRRPGNTISPRDMDGTTIPFFSAPRHASTFVIASSSPFIPITTNHITNHRPLHDPCVYVIRYPDIQHN